MYAIAMFILLGLLSIYFYLDDERALEEETSQTEPTSTENVIEDATTKFFVGTEVHVLSWHYNFSKLQCVHI